MAAFAYLLLPVTGLIAYLTGHDTRARTHGLQAIVVGLVWPLCLYVAAFGPAVAVQITFGVGAVVWLGLLVLTLFGRDPVLPVIGGPLSALAETGTKDEPRSTSGN
jgi:uncharacterized membrane protein